MLDKVWIEKNSPILLVGMYINTVTIENSMEVPWKLKIKSLYDPAIPFLGKCPKKNMFQNGTYAPIFTAAIGCNS